MLSGSFEYDSEESLLILRDYLLANADLQCELVVFSSEGDSPSLVALDDADAIVVFTRRLLTQGAELERLQQYCSNGRPVVGLRTASHAFQHWLELDHEILGGNYDGHLEAGQETAVQLAPDCEHDILDEIEPFPAYGALYRNTPLAEDASVLLHGQAGDHVEPVAWTCERTGRAFTTSLGHQRDFWELDFLRLMENAVRWACGIGPVA